jgi:hypothetical protein
VAVERAHYTATVVQEHTLHSLTLLLQHTQIQYLALRGVPAGAHIWSLFVNSIAAKPVQVMQNAHIVVLVALERP